MPDAEKSNNQSTTEENRVKAERLFFSGQKEKIVENDLEAFKNFDAAVRLYPALDAAWFEMAQILLKQKDYKGAQFHLEKALKASPSNHWYQELYAQVLFANGEIDKATAIFKSLRIANPNNIEYYYDEAYFLEKQNKNKEAIKLYQSIEDLYGIDENTSLQKYRLYLKDSNAEAAEKELQALVKAFPDNLDYLSKLAKFLMANQQTEKAIETFDVILKIDSTNTDALMSMADYHKKQGNMPLYYSYSRRAFANENIGIDTKIAMLYNQIQLFERKEITSLDEAIAFSHILCQTHPDDAKAWAIKGDLFYLSEQNDSAKIAYQKSLSIQQDIFTVWQQLFYILSDEKNYTELIAETEKAKEYFPNQAMVYFFNGLAYQQTKAYENAIKAYDMAKLMANKMPALQAQIYSNLGECYNNQKNYPKSDENFDLSLKIDPNNQYVLNNYSNYLSLRVEQLERAKLMSKRSLELSPDNPTYLDTYAWILYQNKEYQEAYKIQEKAIKLSEKPSADMYEHFGDMLFMINKKMEALTYWQKAKEAGANSSELLQKIKTGGF